MNLEVVMTSGFAIIFILQLFFQLSRTLGTRLSARENLLGTMIMTFVIQSLWLITTAIGVKAVFEMNWYDISGYMIGGLVGNYIAMRMKI